MNTTFLDKNLPVIELSAKEIEILVDVYEDASSNLRKVGGFNIHPFRRKASKYIFSKTYFGPFQSQKEKEIESLMTKKLVVLLYENTYTYGLTKLGIDYAKLLILMDKV